LSNHPLLYTSLFPRMTRHFQASVSRPPESDWSKLPSARLLALFTLVLLLTSCQFTTSQSSAPPQASGGEDWPMYLHDPGRTAVSGETFLSPSNAGQLKKLWAFRTGGVIAASAAIVGGVVYVGSWDGYEYALDARTGAMKWKTFLGIDDALPDCDPPILGVSSGAEVQNGVVYVGGGDGYWYALDAKGGKILWKIFTGNLAQGHFNWSSPLLYKGYAYIGIASVGSCPNVQGQLLQVSLKTHQVVHTLNVVPNGQVGGGIWGSPAIDPTTNTIYVATGDGGPNQLWAQALLAVDATTLTVKSSWTVPPGETVHGDDDDSDFGTTPKLFQDAAGHPLIAAINKNGYLYAFNRNNLAAGPIWRTYIAFAGGEESSISSGVFGDGRFYQAGGNTLIDGKGYEAAVRALDPATGKVLWARGITGMGANAIIAPMAYINGVIMFGAGDLFEILDAATGAVLYSYDTGNPIYAAPSISHGQIFFGSTGGNLYSFGLDSPA
jgi:outer membrane protein assembly factor BamB